MGRYRDTVDSVKFASNSRIGGGAYRRSAFGDTLTNRQQHDGFDAPNIGDFDLIIKAKSPSDAAKQVLEIRQRIVEIVEAGGVEAIDYTSMAMPKADVPSVPALPKGLWAIELKMCVDGFLGRVFDQVDNNQSWRIWCLYRRPNSKWTFDAIAGIEGLTPRTVRLRVSVVDQMVWDCLDAQQWEIT